ncbi:MAG: ABC transporter substrate-binding protein [Actinobacteria bacterium]|nr:ABC transporter substrate-binding protein [Actinomycetota bacterium]
MASGSARRAALGTLLLVLVATACTVGSASTPASSLAEPSDWAAVRQEAEGQTVRWWLYGGDERINRYVDDHVVPAAAELGVTVERVPVTDTADAVQRVVAEVQAGETAGSVDLIWLNGENFALGKEAGLWAEDWADHLPNRRYVDPTTVATDFGVAVEGQESPWCRALFVYAHDTARTPEPLRTFDALLAYARRNPGRITYPAPPDFTGSAFVRQVVQAMGEEEAFRYLGELEPHLWQEGRTHPGSEAELDQLFADGQVDLAMSYDPSFVETGVRQGTFPETVRPFVLDHGTLNNVSYVTVPVNAAHRAGALVVADLLLDPSLQAAKADPEVLGVPTVLDLDLLPVADRERFDATTGSPYLLAEPGELLTELHVGRVERLEQRWRDEVLP